MHVKNVREVPEYEIDPAELDFSNGNDISKVCIYLSRSSTVAVYNLVVSSTNKHTTG